MASIDWWRSELTKNGIHFFHTSKIYRILAYWNFIMWPCVSSLFEWSLIIIEKNNSFLMTISYLKLVVNIGLMFNFHKNLKKSFKCGLFGLFKCIWSNKCKKVIFLILCKKIELLKEKSVKNPTTKNKSIETRYGIVWELKNLQKKYVYILFVYPGFAGSESQHFLKSAKFLHF